MRGKITAHIYNKNGTKLLRKEQREPECGEDFCDKCGDCLHCYSCDPCTVGETDQHFWVIYEES
jgi:hypothetical protein